MKKIFTTAIILVLSLALLVACDTSNNTEANAECLSFVTLSINPEVDLVVDDGIVTAVNPANEDGETLLSVLDLEGETIEDAVDSIVEAANDMEFIDEDSSEINVEVYGDEDTTRIVKEKVINSINERISKDDIKANVTEKMRENFDDSIASLDVEIGMKKLIQKAYDLNPELVVTELAEMETKEVMQIINTILKEERFGYELRKEYLVERAALTIEYSNIDVMAEEIIALETSLTDETLTDEEIASITAQIETKQADLEELKTQYKDAIEELKATYELEYNKKMNNLKEQVKAKLDKEKTANE